MATRVYTAVIRNGEILMVRHRHDGRDYWTLPGGGIETGEEPIDAARREVSEETGIELTDLRELHATADEICFVASCGADQVAIVGYDPELAGQQQIITEVRWFSLEEKRDDLQVREVLARLPGM